MAAPKVYIVGEDQVTQAVLRRVIFFCNRRINILSSLPARGGQINSKLREFDNLSNSYPVILLTDLDAHSCAPELLQYRFPQESFPDGKNDSFIFNVAVDEAEAWLMADRQGFANYFAIDMQFMPLAGQVRQGGGKALTEMTFPHIKSSLYLMSELIQRSQNADYKKQLSPKNNAKKGPEYNSCILPFIQDWWNIDAARQNSDSLARMIRRIAMLN